MAPEQALGLPATPATDVFALGALIACTGSGMPPFGSGPEPISLYPAVHEEPDLSRLPLSLHELVRYCLAKNPEDRPGAAWLIEAARHHPATGGELRFSDGWLPQQVSSELHRHTHLPTTPAPPATVLDPAPADAPTAPALPAPAPTGPEPAPTTRRRAATTARRGARTALLTAAALLVGAAATFLLLDYSDYFDDSVEQNTATASPSPPATPGPPPQRPRVRPRSPATPPSTPTSNSPPPTSTPSSTSRPGR
ncbi:hypothetical protein [Streptomyces sp. NBC_01431]|uniref:hypothetical protein n=1 Tax=Streptomyces sp. NBC_01431 TaxID=2903863 RepID=UPI002E3157D3|nr:hypothetical protein [Streptomyces sp. NBC_01431]